MKKVFLSFALVAAAFVSCGDDDNGDSNGPVCQTCEVELLGVPIVSEICDNGDGTVSITTDGETQTQTLEEGQTYAQIIAGFEATGATCN